MSDLANYKMSPATRRVFEALVPVVCAPEWEELGIMDELMSELELALRSMPALARRGLTLGLRVYDLGAVLRFGRRASGLEGDRAVRYYESWARGHGVRGDLIRGARGLVAMNYYELPSVQARIGYTPQEWIDRVIPRRRESYGEDIERHERSLFEPDPIPLPSEVERAAEEGRDG